MMPLEAGDVFDPGVVLSPSVPAEIQVRFRVAPDSDAARISERTITGIANRFGYFHLAGSGIVLDRQGEYRVDITASYRDERGNLWMGSRTWGGVIAPRNASIVAHGSRGIDTQPFIGPQWFFRTQTGLPVDDGHVSFPFHSGDVTWHQQSDSALPVIRFHDPGGRITGLMRARNAPGDFLERAAAEAYLFSSRGDNVDPHIDPDRIDLWAYFYASVERPLVRVREEISENGIASAYWRFNESYALQIGSEASPDLRNDIKFQYGAAVIRGSAVGTPQYAIYGSLFVLVPDVDPGGGTRTFPPFQGNGADPVAAQS